MPTGTIKDGIFEFGGILFVIVGCPNIGLDMDTTTYVTYGTRGIKSFGDVVNVGIVLDPATTLRS